MTGRFRCACGATFDNFPALIDHENALHRPLRKS